MEGLRVLLDHPEVATRPCHECQKFVYDDRGQRVKRAGQFVLRPAGAKPPCHQCPKQSPAEAHRFELSARNQRLVAYYFQARASAGQLPLDELARERLGMIDYLIRHHEQKTLAQQIAWQLAPFIRGRK